jgi:hypothetical protein
MKKLSVLFLLSFLSCIYCYADGTNKTLKQITFGDGTVQTTASSGGSGSTIYNATSTAGFPFGISVSTISGSANTVKIVFGNHIEISSTTPSLSACGGAGPIITGNDYSGNISPGSAATSCTVTFVSQWSQQPSCFCDDEGTLLHCRTVTTTTSLVMTPASGSFTSGGPLKYGCMGWK